MTDGTEPVAPPIELAPPLVGTGGMQASEYTPPAFVPPAAAQPAYAPPAYAPPAAPAVPAATGDPQIPAAALPPYANQAAYAAPAQSAAGHPVGSPYLPPPGHPAAAQYAAPAQPVRSSRRTTTVVVSAVVAVIAVFALIVVSLSIATSTLVSNSGSGPDIAAPIAPAAPDADPDAAAVAEIRAALDAKIAEYRATREDGTLWERIPDTDFNRTAVTAFLYLLTDMKVATGWGVDADTAAGYAQEMDDLENRLLDEEPLGSDVTISLSDRTFTYDGSTGEGGYTDD